MFPVDSCSITRALTFPYLSHQHYQCHVTPYQLSPSPPSPGVTSQPTSLHLVSEVSLEDPPVSLASLEVCLASLEVPALAWLPHRLQGGTSGWPGIGQTSCPGKHTAQCTLYRRERGGGGD